MTAHADANAYLRTKVLTASPEELRLMLLDGAIKFLRQGKDALERKDYEAAFNGISRCRNIILELINGVKPEPDRDLYTRVTGVYTFMYTTLVEANLEKDTIKCDKVLELLDYERETWVLLMAKLVEERAVHTAAENRQAAVAAADPVVAGAAPTGYPHAPRGSGSPSYRPLSVQG
jgi:flagellar secretion chaperone FliS